MKLHHILAVISIVVLVGSGLLMNRVATTNNESNLLSQSQASWNQAIELRCRRVIANYAHGVGGVIYSVRTGEKLYQGCLKEYGI